MRFSVATCWISRGYAWAMNLVAYDEIQATKHAEFKQQKWWSYNGNIVGVYSDTLLVGGLEHEFYFPYIGNNHPNWLSYFSEGLKPPTRLLEIAQADSGGFNQRLYGDSLFFFVARRRHWNDGNCKETHPRFFLVQIVELLFYLYINTNCFI